MSTPKLNPMERLALLEEVRHDLSMLQVDIASVSTLAAAREARISTLEAELAALAKRNERLEAVATAARDLQTANYSAGLPQAVTERARLFAALAALDAAPEPVTEEGK